MSENGTWAGLCCPVNGSSGLEEPGVKNERNEGGWIPVLLRVKGKVCVVVGGGEVASRKVRSLLPTGCRLRVVSPEVTPEIRRLWMAGRLEWKAKGITAADLAEATLVVVATDDEEINTLVSQWARTQGVLCNVVDSPELCTVYFPAVLRRGGLVVSVSTCGASPALAAVIRDKIADIIGEDYALLVDILAKLRGIVLETVPDKKKRNRILKTIVDEGLVEACKKQDEAGLCQLLEKAGVSVSNTLIQDIMRQLTTPVGERDRE